MSWNPENRFVTDRLGRFYSLDTLIKQAYDAGDFETAAKRAGEYLDLAAIYRCNWNYGNAIHDANRYLGLMSLKRGESEAASACLIEASRSRGSPQLDSFGPDMDLANALLKEGRFEPVKQYLKGIKTFWKMDNGQVDDWLGSIDRGEQPELDRFRKKPGAMELTIVWITIAWPFAVVAAFLHFLRHRMSRKCSSRSPKQGNRDGARGRERRELAAELKGLSRRASLILRFAAIGLAGLPIASAAEGPPAWAYPINPPDFKLSADDGSIRRVPGSTAEYTLSQARDPFVAPDWHPESHPQMPSVVARGVKPEVFACGYCHRAEGTGGPENASLAGLPMAYIIAQMEDYKSGARTTAVAKRAPQALMIRAAKAVSDEDVRSAAAYFSALKPKRNMKVIESDLAPTTFVANWFFAAASPPAREPLGQRIVEVPDELDRFESRDTRVTFSAHVPPGSLERGRSLVTGRDTAKAPACVTCHGTDMRGVDAIPSIAGRSPTYMVRQLYELKAGVRSGPGAQPMKEVVANLGEADMIAIAAYLATLDP